MPWADILAWLDTHAGAVQGIATIVLVGITAVYAWLTRLQVRAASRQLDETIRSSVQPFVHVVSGRAGASTIDNAGRVGFGAAGLTEFSVVLTLRNLGPGPALSVPAHLRHDWLKFTPTTDPLTLSPGGDSQELAFRPGEGGPRPGVPWPKDVSVLIEYRDILGHWWATTIQVRPLSAPKADGTLAFGPDLYVVDLTERVRSLPRPRIHQDTLAVDAWTPFVTAPNAR